MSELNIKLTRTVNRLAGALAAVIALSFPLGFFALQYQFHAASMDVEAEFNAINITRLINANPEFWQFEEPRLQELLKAMSHDSLPEWRRILDAQGRVVTGSPALLAAPVIMRTAALLDSGHEVGRLEVARSLLPLLLETVLAGLFGLLLGSLVQLLLTRHPLRALKQALASLQHEKERAQVTLQAISDAVITSDRRGQVLSFNLAAEKMFGYAAAEVIGRDLKILMPEPYRGEPDGKLGRDLLDGPANWIGTEHELTARRSDGGTFTLALRVSRFDLDGQPQFIASLRDITRRKRADLTLASTHRALQMLSRSSMAINRIDDEAGLLAEVCRVAVEVGGYRMAWVGYAQDDEAKSILPMAHAGEESGYLDSIKLYWGDDQPGGCGPAGQAIRSGQPQQSGDISKADSHFYWHEAAMQRGYRSALVLPLRSEQRSFGVLCLYAGEIQQFAPEEVKLLQELADNLAFGIGSLRARLERRRHQQAAREATAKVQEQAALLDKAQDAIMVRNLDRTLRFWNKGAEHLYGWTSEEVLGKTMDELMYRSPQVLATAMNQALASDGDWTGELAQVARDGSTIHVQARWTVVRDGQGQANGVLGINTDIRERKKAREEILRLNADLEERVRLRTAQLEFANQQLEAFSYSVAHDLRSPLSTIAGFSGLLEKAMAKTSGGPPDERSQHYLARIRAGASRMGELIEALLALAQVSRSSLRWEPVDLSALAVGLLTGYQEGEPARTVQLRVESGLLAQGDPQLLNQVLDNLLGNAWKFSAGQPVTEITFGHDLGEAGETVYFVRDNGAGFDMAYAEKLFGAFERLHSPTEFAGNGIGLTTVLRIIARHGGRVWGESAAGCGATFYFTLGLASL